MKKNRAVSAALAVFALMLVTCVASLAYSPPRLQAPSNYQGADYLNVVCDQGVFRWNQSRLPLSVYIADGAGMPGYRASFRNLMSKAFDEWCRSSGGRLSWRQVSNSRDADIVCVWTPTTKEREGGLEAGVTVTTIRPVPGMGGTRGVIENAKVSILTQLFGRSFSDGQIYKTCLHEVGHALGLQGHSNNQADIMYPSMNSNQVAYLKDRDVNTINRLYSGYNESQTLAQSPNMGAYASAPFTSGAYGGTGSMPDSESYRDANSVPAYGSAGGNWGRDPGYTRGPGNSIPLQYSSPSSPYYIDGGPTGYSQRRGNRDFNAYPGAYRADANMPGPSGNMLSLGQREAIRQLARQAAMQRLQQQYQRGW